MKVIQMILKGMMNSKHSDYSSQSKAFDSFHEKVQRWIWSKGWKALYDIQEESTPIIMKGEDDLIISATTAGGKTEAVFFPVVSKLAFEIDKNPPKSFQVLYISPLKALINDQYQRLEDLCSSVGDIFVCPWHGDASKSTKMQGLKNPQGILLITPESLEALFVNRGYEVTRLFNDLRFIVIDEIHSFLGLERGKQLQSLMSRVDHAIGRCPSRIGLSATIGDMEIAANFLQPNNGDKVKIIKSCNDARELKVQLRGYLDTATQLDQDSEEVHESVSDISEHLFKTLRGENNLIFANSRSVVEKCSDQLRLLSEKLGVLNEFLPHHGNLSKTIREEAECLLKETNKPASIVCTSTLELGIDVGSVRSVAQIGAPHSVSGLRQRLGRSGRRDDDPSILRIYISEKEIKKDTAVSDKLRFELVQGISLIQLLVQKWCEPSRDEACHFSTLIQQILSVIAERGGITAEKLYYVLCKKGAFSNVASNSFVELLRCLADQKHDIVQQSRDSTLLLSPKGERIVNHYDFYAAFQSSEEFKIIANGKTLGSVPGKLAPVKEDAFMVFAGKRWKVIKIRQKEKIIEVIKAAGGVPPRFCSVGGRIHDHIVKEMFKVFISAEQPLFLNKQAVSLLNEGRNNFVQNGLDRRWFVQEGEYVSFLTWSGSKITNAICLLLLNNGLKVDPSGQIVVQVKTSEHELINALKLILKNANKLNPLDLAMSANNKVFEKHDIFLSEELLSMDYEKKYLDLDGAINSIRFIIEEKTPREFCLQ